MIWLGLGLIVFGVIFGVVGAMLLRHVLRFERTAEATQATVARINTRRENDGTYAYAVVRFTLPHGREVESEISSTSTNRAVGDLVDVRYDPLQPENVEYAGAGNRIAASVFIGLGAVALVAGVAVMLTSS